MSCQLNVGGQYSCLSAGFNRCAICPITKRENEEAERVRRQQQQDKQDKQVSPSTEFHKNRNSGIGVMMAVTAAIWGAVYFSNKADTPVEPDLPDVPGETIDSGTHESDHIFEKIKPFIPDFSVEPVTSLPRPLPFPMVDKPFAIRQMLEEGQFFLGAIATTSELYRDNSLIIVYRGEAQDGVINGNGRLWYQNPNYKPSSNTTKYFMGYFNNGELDGFGRMTYNNATIDYVEANWMGTIHQPIPEGDFRVHFKDGSDYYGVILNGIVQHGYCVSADGQNRTIIPIPDAGQIPVCMNIN